MIGHFTVTSRAPAMRVSAPMRLPLVVALIAWLLGGCGGNAPAARLYTNPLRILPTAAGPFESCADPAIIRGQQPGDQFWYLYCTDNPLNGADRAANGRLNDHFIPMLRSRDLIEWTYMGDAFSARPAWSTHSAASGRRISSTSTASITSTTPSSARGSRRGRARSASPPARPRLGPWTDSGGPVVEPQAEPSGGTDRRWVFDSAVVTDDAGQRYLFYGSFIGGISARRLSADGLHTDPASEVPIASANRYEATSIVKHGGYYYLFASAGECCNGPLSGYGVLAGRATDILGPYTDREGVSLLAGQVGGTPVLSANGNRWVGAGGSTVFTDDAGQDWFLYHAVDRTDPYFAGSTATKRPALLDRLDWIDGWPVVHGGLGPSDTPQRAPVDTAAARRPMQQSIVAQLDPLGPLDARSRWTLPHYRRMAAADPAFPAESWAVDPPACRRHRRAGGRDAAFRDAGGRPGRSYRRHPDRTHAGGGLRRGNAHAARSAAGGMLPELRAGRSGDLR